MTKEQTTSLNLYQKLAAITGEIGAIGKDGRNSEQKYAFIEYAAIAGRLRTLFSTYGVVVVPNMISQERTEISSKYGSKGYHTLARFKFDVVNADSPTERFSVEWESEAADFGDKATNKAATAALKYYLMRQFNISEKGEDADEAAPNITAAKPAIGSGLAKSAPSVAQAAKPDVMTPNQLKLMMTLFNQAGIGDDRDRRIAYIKKVIQRPIESAKELTKAETADVINELQEGLAATAIAALEEPTEPTPQPDPASSLQASRIKSLLRARGVAAGDELPYLTDNFGITDWGFDADDADMIIDTLTNNNADDDDASEA